jgi:peptide/nickel transport system permease protein
MPLVTGVVVMYTFVFIAVNVLIDIVYFMVDPRVRAAEAA